jgi:two-component system CheB/CheR fusion protein
LRAILGGGGVCMVQEPSSAKYDGMPTSAINAGYATHILPVEQMPSMLVEVTRQAVYRQRAPSVTPEKTLSGINQILLQLRSATGHDFSLYKKSTIGRRIQRRMAQHAIEDEAVYARFLKGNPTETQLLFRELLINVTSFFRDPEAFAALKETILPSLLKGKPPGYDFRVWVAGCASGEEAYSIAILLQEVQDEIHARHDQELNIQIYATDLDDDAIALARAGRYPPNIAQDVTPERLRRFFTKDDGGYKVKKDIRDMVVFAVQNVIKDPPFTKLDLLSCRNLMIYLETELQNRLIPNFHYALRPNGVLFLSASESITSRPDLFTAIDRKWKFYRTSQHLGAPPHRATADMAWTQMVRIEETSGTTAGMAAAVAAGKAVIGRAGNIAALSTHALLQNYAPASVTTDRHGNILYVHGDTGRYLRPAPGPVNNNVVEMARQGLQNDLRFAINNAAGLAESTLNKEVAVKTNGGFSTVRFSVRALPHGKSDDLLLLVSFEDVAEGGNPTGKPADQAAGKLAAAAKPGRGKRSAGAQSAKTPDALRIEELERELAYAKENLQATSEEQQASNEELKSTNEELQSTNEELQSSNEELETSKEELQSLNEETITVNSELNARIEQLTNIQNDMKNLLDSIGTGTLFLDHHLVIRRYTPAAVKVYRLIGSDVGRPLSDITSNLGGAHSAAALQADLQSVLDTLIPIEREVHCSDGAWYLARIQPYRTLDNVIEGVVLTFTPVTEFKLASEAARAAAELAATQIAATQLARELAEGIVNTVIEPLIVLDGSLQVVSASRSFYEHFQVAAEQTVGRKIYDLGNGQWNIPALRELLENILPQNQVMDGYVVEHNFPGLGQRRMVLNARHIVTAQGNTELILLAMVTIASPEAP